MISKIKCLIKHYLSNRRKARFKRVAIIGENVSVYYKAFLTAPTPEQIQIGNNSEIAGTFACKGNGRITLGKNSWVGAGTVIGSVEEISIGDYAIISTEVHIYDNNNHPTDPALRQKMCESGFHSELWGWQHADAKRIKIGDRVWIGERSTILKGVTIGNDSIVAAGSVVTHDVPSNSIAAGNPAKIVKQIKA